MSRRRYRWNPETQAMEEVGLDYSSAERRAPVPTEQIVYGNLGKATDGTPIDSRKKHREYMAQNGLTVSDDFKGTWAKAEQERERFFKGEHNHEERRERRDAIGRAIYERNKR